MAVLSLIAIVYLYWRWHEKLWRRTINFIYLRARLNCRIWWNFFFVLILIRHVLMTVSLIKGNASVECVHIQRLQHMCLQDQLLTHAPTLMNAHFNCYKHSYDILSLAHFGENLRQHNMKTTIKLCVQKFWIPQNNVNLYRFYHICVTNTTNFRNWSTTVGLPTDSNADKHIVASLLSVSPKLGFKYDSWLIEANRNHSSVNTSAYRLK